MTDMHYNLYNPIIMSSSVAFKRHQHRAAAISGDQGRGSRTSGSLADFGALCLI